MGGRLHAGDVDGIEFIDVFQDLGELRLEFGDFLIAQMQPGQACGVTHIKFGTHKEREENQEPGKVERIILVSGVEIGESYRCASRYSRGVTPCQRRKIRLK